MIEHDHFAFYLAIDISIEFFIDIIIDVFIDISMNHRLKTFCVSVPPQWKNDAGDTSLNTAALMAQMDETHCTCENSNFAPKKDRWEMWKTHCCIVKIGL